MITTYFAGLTWLNRGRVLCASPIERNFIGRYGINYAHDGGMTIAYDHRPGVLVRGPVAWISRPGHFVYGAIGGGTWENRYLNFTGPRVPLFARRGLIDLADPIIPVSQPELVRATFDALFDLLEGERCDQAQSVHQLEGLLLLLRRQGEAPALPTGRAAAVEALCRRLRESPQEVVDLARAASDLGVSLPTLRRSFIAVTGLPPHQYLLRARMQRAAELLGGTTLPVAAIAAEVGMGDQYQFAKCFRRHHLMTPSAWRAEARAVTGGGGVGGHAAGADGHGDAEHRNYVRGQTGGP